MIEYIAGALTALVGIYAGYVIGKNSSIIPEKTQKQVRRLIRELPIQRGLGAVPRPTAHEVKKFNDPKLKAEEEEMSKTFKKIVK